MQPTIHLQCNLSMQTMLEQLPFVTLLYYQLSMLNIQVIGSGRLDCFDWGSWQWMMLMRVFDVVGCCCC